ncbi:matrix metalloproteinase-28 isoform X2 [Sphaerodactylus townsendi]|uniref:matrix metalloproteinase-28 isoform X2 n=1 Tax=Sphaerodactylus townsendi TaxID=933632 RepID=UPI0020271819|nr:matrix metalloproteinase-28 isoform X2 [Sphaerodactylus townsendi]
MAPSLLRRLFWLPLVQLCAVASPQPDRLGEAERFLEKYGYLGSTHQGTRPAVFSEAVREFQRLYHLSPSGKLDPSTMHQMSLPRCGMNDTRSFAAWKERVDALFLGQRAEKKRRRRYSHQSGQWYKRHLTYRVVNWPWYLPQQQVHLAVKAAFELWSNVSSLVFWEATSDSADIRLTFFHGDHNDGTDNAFDGPGGALAHAFFPRRGEAHFDNDERWSLDSSKGRNLFVVVAHEIGHTLGLEHSPVRRALMSPYYKKLGKDFVLSWDDILAIQNLYVQLPGKLFARFQDWSQDIEGREHLNRNRSAHYCKSFFDAITEDLEGNVYIFKGGYFWTISKAGNATGPQLLWTKWPGLPSTIDAAAFSEEDGKFYFFKGGRCWRYVGSSLEAGFPQKCSNTGDLPRHPDASLYFQPLRHLVLFKGPKYYVVNEETFQVEPYYPRSLRDWGGVPTMTNGALTHSDGFVYFFRNDRFWKFDPDKLQVVASGKWAPQLQWLGCQAEDSRKAGA